MHNNIVETIMNKGTDLDLNQILGDKIKTKIQCKKCALAEEILDEGWKGALVGAALGGLATGGNPVVMAGTAALGSRLGDFGSRARKQMALRSALKNRIKKLENRPKSGDPKKDSFLSKKSFEYKRRLKSSKHPLSQDVLLGHPDRITPKTRRQRPMP